MNERHMPDGSIVFPMRGKPPVCDLPGFMVDPDDAYRWIMIYCPCRYRELNKPYICPSGKLKHKDYCNLLQLNINPAYCNNTCQVPDKIIVQ